MEDIVIDSLRGVLRAYCSTTMPVIRLCIALLVTFLCCTCSNAQEKISLYRSPMLSPCHGNNKARQTFVRDPLDCSLFYTCFGNRFWKMSCTTPGTVYSLTFKVCVWRNSLYDDCTNSREEESIESNLVDDKKHVPVDSDSKSLTDSKSSWMYKNTNRLHPTKSSPPFERKGKVESNQVEDVKDTVTKQPEPQPTNDKEESVLKKSKTTLHKKGKDSRLTEDRTEKWSKERKETVTETLESSPVDDDKVNTLEKSPDADSDFKNSAEDLNWRRVDHNDDKPPRRLKPVYPPRNPFITPFPWTQFTTRTLRTSPSPSRRSTTPATPASTAVTERTPTTTTPSTTVTAKTMTQRTPPVTTSETTLRTSRTTPRWKATAKPQRRWKPKFQPFTPPPTPLVTTTRSFKWWDLSKSTTSPRQRQQQRPKPTRVKVTPMPRRTEIPEITPTALPDREITTTPSLPPRKPTPRPPRRRTTPALSQQQQQQQHKSTVPPPRRKLTPESRQPPTTQRQQTQVPLRSEPTLTRRPKQNEGETLKPHRRKFVPNPRGRQPQQHQQQRTRQPPLRRPAPTSRPDRQRRPTPRPREKSLYPTTRPHLTRLPDWWMQKKPPVTQLPPHHRRRPKPSRPQGPEHLKIRTTPEPIRWWRPTTPLPRRQRVTTATTTTTSKPGRWWGWTLVPTRRPFLRQTTTTEPMTTALTTTMATVREVRYTWKTAPSFHMTRPITTPTIVTTTSPRPQTTTTTLSTTTSSTSRPATTTTTAAPATTTPEAVTRMSTLPHRAQMAEHCGIMARPMIIGGRPSSPGQWPWQVSLQIIAAVEPWHRCGGVLIHPSWVLTAAHCVEGPFYGDVRNWRVVLAEDNLEVESGREIYRRIARIVSHPGYIRTSNFPNDVALLQLDEGVDLTTGEVRVACLPDEDTPPPDLAHCWISGWGETRGSGGVENAMNELPVHILDNEDCSSMWLRVGIHVLDDQLCVGYGDTGACYGDSGGPLMCEQEGRFYITGVMSWLINNCSARGFPNVFTRVTSYLDWIYEKLDFYEWWRYN